jgi:hypothetical protein
VFKGFKSYNLDIFELDNFYVGEFGILAHNANGKKDDKDKGGKKASDAGKNDPHGNAKKAASLRADAAKIREQIKELKSGPIKQQQSNAQKIRDLNKTAKNIEMKADKVEKGETHGKRAKGQSPC